MRFGASIALLAIVSCLPVRAGAWATADDERASREMIRYGETEEDVRKLLATGAPATVLAALRAHERSKEIRLRTLAQALLYEHAPRLGVGEAEREHLRRLLMAVAEDKKAPGTARDEALRVLIGNTWAGRDDWYEARLADPTLRHPSDGGTAYSPLGWPLRTDPDRWVPWLIPRLARKGVIRSSVAHVLAELADSDGREKRPPRRDVAVALMPWLADRNWAEGVDYHTSPRAEYVTSLGRLDLREAIPGLIHIVETEPDYVGARAAGVLEQLRDPQALPALRKAAPAHLGVQWERDAFFRAITACGGLTPLEAVGALEVYARTATTREGLERIRTPFGGSGPPLDAKVALGVHLAHQQTIDDATVAQVIALWRRTSNPEVAHALEAPLFAWEAKAARLHVVSRLADRDLDDRLLRRALRGRNVLAASVAPELRGLLARGGTAAGRAAAVLDDREAIARVLRGKDIPAILGLLHAAVVSDRRGLDRSEDWLVFSRGAIGGSVHLAEADVGPLLGRAEADLAVAARAWLTREGGPRAKAWLVADGKPVGPATAESHAYNVAGVAPGMKRGAVDKGQLGSAGRVEYDAGGSVVALSGKALRDATREIVPASARAADVRRLFGRPDHEHGDHVFATVGGFFWRYARAGVVIVFAFVDDRSTLGDEAPLFGVSLFDPTYFQARFGNR